MNVLLFGEVLSLFAQTRERRNLDGFGRLTAFAKCLTLHASTKRFAGCRGSSSSSISGGSNKASQTLIKSIARLAG